LTENKHILMLKQKEFRKKTAQSYVFVLFLSKKLIVIL